MMAIGDRTIVDAIRVAIPTQVEQSPNDPPTCSECGDEYALRDGCEPSLCCDPCAHAVLARIVEVLDREVQS